MSFSWGRNTGESDNDYNTRYTSQRKSVIDQESDKKSKEDRQYNDSLKVNDINIDLANKKALDIVTRKKANYDAGIADPEETLAAENKLKADRESGLTDYEQYDRKQALDLKNQDTAWQSASKYRQSDAGQQLTAQKDRLVTDISGQKDRLVAGLDNQKTLQQNTINQANKLRSDDNQRAINGFKGNI